MKLIDADKVEQAIKDYWKTQVDKLPKPGNVRDHDDFVDRLNSYIEHNHELLKAIDELPSAEPDTTTHDSNVVKTSKNDGDRTSGDCISRQQAIEAVEKSMYENPHENAILRGMHDHEHRHFLTILMGLPSVQPERKTGRWIAITSWNNTYKCSVCGRLLVNITDGKNKVAKNYPYCHCGADMRGDKHEID